MYLQLSASSSRFAVSFGSHWVCETVQEKKCAQTQPFATTYIPSASADRNILRLRRDSWSQMKAPKTLHDCPHNDICNSSLPAHSIEGVTTPQTGQQHDCHSCHQYAKHDCLCSQIGKRLEEARTLPTRVDVQRPSAQAARQPRRSCQ